MWCLLACVRIASSHQRCESWPEFKKTSICVVSSPPFSANLFLDLLQIAGEWYSILLASDAKENIEENGSMRVFVEHIRVLDNSSLAFKFQRK